MELHLGDGTSYKGEGGGSLGIIMSSMLPIMRA